MALVLSFFLNQKFFESPASLFTTARHKYFSNTNITLRKNETIETYIGEIDGGFYYKGKYKIPNDTLLLQRNDISQVTNGIISNFYFY